MLTRARCEGGGVVHDPLPIKISTKLVETYPFYVMFRTSILGSTLVPFPRFFGYGADLAKQ